MKTARYRRIVLASAWYDLLVTAPFATPWSFTVLHEALSAVAVQVGVDPLPAFAPMHVLMANLLGSIVCIWAVLRIRHPRPRFGRYDAAGRLLFSLWQLYALTHGASLVLLPFLLAEVGWMLAQTLPLVGGKNSRAAIAAPFVDHPRESVGTPTPDELIIRATRLARLCRNA